MPSDDAAPTTVIRVLFAATFIEVVGFGMVLPILPLLLTEPSSQFFLLPASYSMETGLVLLGLLIAFYPLGQFVATPILGQLSDRYGRRPLLILSIAGTVVASTMFGLAIIWANIPLMFASRLLNGLTGGNISIVQAAIADVSPTGEKSKNFGRISAAFGLGFVVGPFLGGLLSSPGIHPAFTAATPFFAAAGVSALSAVLVHYKLAETSPLDQATTINWKQSIDNVVRAFRMPQRRALFTTSFLYYAGFAFLTSFIGVFLIQRFGFNQFDIGNYFLYIGLVVLITQLVIVPRFYRRFAEGRTLPFTLLGAGVAVLLIYRAEVLLTLIVFTPLFSVSNGLNQVAITTLISNTGNAKDQGLILGINSSLRALATAVPSALAGGAAALFAPETPLLISGAVIVLTAVGYAAWRKWLQKKA